MKTLNHTHNKAVNALSALMIMAGIFAISCCTLPSKMPEMIKNNVRLDADSITLEKGYTAFKNKNYKKALEIFGILSQLSEENKIRRKALYGLACTRLILAENINDLNESIILWDAWSQLAPDEIDGEDPRMLRPFLERKAFYVIRKGSKKRLVLGKHNVNLNELQNKEKEINDLQEKMKNMENEIQVLKHQIDSLEAIDQEIQQKKQEISSP